MEHDPLSCGRNAVVALIQTRQTRQHSIVVVGHVEKDRRGVWSRGLQRACRLRQASVDSTFEKVSKTTDMHWFNADTVEREDGDLNIRRSRTRLGLSVVPTIRS